MQAFRGEHPRFTRALFAETHAFAHEEQLASYTDALAAAGMPDEV